MLRKKENILKQLQQNKRKQIIYFFSSMIVIFLYYIIMHNSIIDTKILQKNAEKNKDLLWNFSLDENKKDLIGRFYTRSMEIQDIRIVLQATDGTERYLFETEEFGNEQMNYPYEKETNEIKILCELDKRIKNDKTYELFVHYSYKEIGKKIEEFKSKKIGMNLFLYNEEIYFYDPMTFIQPFFVDENINQVIKSGILCYYNQNIGCWIYKYKDELYWIVNENFGLNQDGSTHIPFHLYTKQIENLHEWRQPYEFDSRDFLFEEKEYILEENSEYRVAIVNFPKEYIVTCIETGIYDSVTATWLKRFSFDDKTALDIANIE